MQSQTTTLNQQHTPPISSPSSSSAPSFSSSPFFSNISRTTSSSTATCSSSSSKTKKRIKFNVGGQIYEVSASLLDMHPDTMIAKITSSQWHCDPNTEVFIERDGTLFGYVLKYLRDRQVTLPLTVTKKELIAEFRYYGIQDVDIQAIDDSETQSFLAVKNFNKGGQSLRDLIEKSRNEATDLYIKRCCLLVSADCIEMYVNQGNHLEKCHFTINELMETSTIEKHFEKVFETKDIALDICNEHLSKAGLKLSNLERSSRYFVGGTNSSYAIPGNMEGMSSRFGRGYSYEVTLMVVGTE